MAACSQNARGDVNYLVFKSAGLSPRRSDLDGDLRFVVWQPAPWRIRPPSLGLKSALWWLAHYVRIFRNRDYVVLLIVNGDTIVHRSCAIPACFRWPFMRPDDIQISSTWTDREYRGRGLATIALREAVARLSRPGRKFWYLTRVENAASVAVCCKAGFSFIGWAQRKRRLGIRLLGFFEMCADAPCDEKTRGVA